MMNKAWFVGWTLFLACALCRADETPWHTVILTASEQGWFETRGMATIDDDLKKIVVKDEAGKTKEIYTGQLKGAVWTGSRAVQHSDNISEPLQGKLSKRRIGSREYQTLILSNNWVSANFIRVLKLSQP